MFETEKKHVHLHYHEEDFVWMTDIKDVIPKNTKL